MKIELIKRFEGLDMYGDIPCLPVIISDGAGERFIGEESDSWLLLQDFVPGIDAICSNVLDYGDVDFFDAEKCKIVLKWIAQRRQSELKPRLSELYEQIEEYMKQAVAMNTGVVIGL